MTTQAKSDPFEYIHDEIGYNYRMPNLNAAVACAQLEQLDLFLKIKKELADYYDAFFQDQEDVRFVRVIDNARANYWLNTIVFAEKGQKEEFLEYSNSNRVMTRPIWRLMNKLPMYKDSIYMQHNDNADYIYKTCLEIKIYIIIKSRY